MAVGFPPEDFAQEASLTRAESAQSPGNLVHIASAFHFVQGLQAAMNSRTSLIARKESMFCTW